MMGMAVLKAILKDDISQFSDTNSYDTICQSKNGGRINIRKNTSYSWLKLFQEWCVANNQPQKLPTLSNFSPICYHISTFIEISLFGAWFIKRRIDDIDSCKKCSERILH